MKAKEILLKLKGTLEEIKLVEVERRETADRKTKAKAFYTGKTTALSETIELINTYIENYIDGCKKKRLD